MPRLTRKGMIAAVAALVGVIIGGILIALNRQRPYDPDFDTRVVNPAYRGGGPVVLYDEGHSNIHTSTAAYKPFADLIRSDGYDLRVTTEALSPQTLEDVSTLVIVLARGSNETNDDAAFEDSECAVVEEWVRSGGSLLLVTDHWPFGAAMASLVQKFDVQSGKGLVEDSMHHERNRGQSHLVFSVENGLLRDHPITRGRNPAERIQRVLTFTGQSMLGPQTAVPFLVLSDVAIEYPPTVPRVEKDGGDVRVHMDYGEPISASGRAQGLAMELGRGRIVILGEAGMLRAERPRRGQQVGMNVPGYDNRQLAINIMHWLSRLL